MADDDSIFDTSKMKKKKVKKTFDLDAALADGMTGMGGSSSTKAPAQESYTANTEANDDHGNKDDHYDINLERDDFSGVKKKKKKKVLNLEEIESALPDIQKPHNDNMDGDADDGNKLDGFTDQDNNFDFSLPKKKKKKKIMLDDLAGEVPQEDDDERETAESESKSKQSSSGWFGSDRDYTYEELLTRVFDIMREKNPDMVAGEKRRFVMRPPQVVRVGTKKSSFANFTEICKMLHRQPKHLLAFLLAELGTSGSVDGNNQLIIKGRFQQKQIENVLRRYIKEYVTCHTCRSPDTILQKDTRLFFLQCETCGSRCSVASIKSGFQAVTGKRAAIRAKTA